MLSDRLSTTTLAATILAGAALWFSLGVLAVLDDGTRIGVLPSPILLLLSVTVSVATAAAVRLSSQTALPLFLSALVILPWIPVRVPNLFLLFTGPTIALLWACIALCVASILIRRYGGSQVMRLNECPTAPWVAAAIAFVVFVAVRVASGGPPSGDEPHYLVIAESILEDGDLKVANNYERQHYLTYFRGSLTPHLGRPGLDGEQYSIHAPGVPVVIAPAFRVAGYRGVVVWIAALVAFGSALIWRAGYLVTRDAGAAWFGWCAVTLTVPVVLHGSLVYPDPLGGLMLAGGTYALAVVDDCGSASNEPRRVRANLALWFWVGLGTGLLPWLHTRLALAAAPLSAVLLLRLGAAVRRGAATRKHVAAYAIPIAVCFAGWLAFFRILYGTFNPSVPYGDQLPVAAGYIPAGLLGLLADQQFGLLPNAPIYFLCVAGLWCLFVYDRRLTFELLLVICPYVLASSGFPLWFGGAAPPARFLVPVVFPLGVALAALWARQGRTARSMSLGVLALSVLIAAVLAVGGDGRLAYNDNDGRAASLDWIAPLVDLPRAFPSFFRAGSTLTPRAQALVVYLVEPTFVWCAIILAGWLLFRVVVARLPDTVAFRTVATACCLLAMGAAGVSANWRLSGGSRLTSTRSQLRLLHSDDPRTRPFGVRLPRIRAFDAGEARAELALSTSRLDRPSPDALLYLAEVPAGDYRLRIKRRESAEGTVFVGIGSSTGAPWQGSLADGSADAIVLRLPTLVSSITVKGDQNAAQVVEGVTLVPAPRGQSSGRQEGRARDAMRYGPLVVFTIDDRVRLDTAGFWLLGERQREVIVATDTQRATLEFELRNVSIDNRVRVSAGRWSAERVLAPDEVWRLRAPVAGLGQSFRLGFQVASSLPAREGSLSCRVEFR
jgi:hypothetical protein